MKSIRLTIDGVELEAADRTPLLRVAEQAGISIPTLCHHPLLEPYGVCRLCTVEVHTGRRARLVTSCNYPAAAGIEVLTSSERVRRARRLIIEWLMGRAGHVAVIEKLAGEYGVTEPRFGRGDETCILCGLCVRVCRDLVGQNVLGFVGRGTTRAVSTAFGETSEQCIACGACAYVCPTGSIRIEGQEEQLRRALPLGPTSAIHIPFMQAVPHKPVIDRPSCIHFRTGRCKVCDQVCEAKAIDHRQEERVETLEVGTVVVATGFQGFDAGRIPELGYGRLPDVLSGLDFERMNNASGPTGGRIVCQGGRAPRSVGVVHCVGSRDARHHEYCSRVCCMYALKFAHLIREKTGAEVYNFYIDMRCFGKGYEEFYQRLLAEGVHMVRGRVAAVSDWAETAQEEGRLVVRVEDTLVGVVRRVPVDMVVLATGLEPRADAGEVRRRFNISCSREGWFLERHPKLAPVSTFTDGVFLAGACQGPKDIPDAVAQAGAAAAEALALVDRARVELEPNTAYIQEELCSGCRTCIPMCPFQALAVNGGEHRAQLNEALCKGCGTCVAACPSGALQQNLFTDRQIYQEIEGVLAHV